MYKLLLIDPQNDFCEPDGNLYVTNADKDCLRVSTLINKLTDHNLLSDIVVTCDTHPYFHITFASSWLDKDLVACDPFSIISADIVKDRELTYIKPELHEDAMEALQQFALHGRTEQLTLWPDHCIRGNWNAAINKNVNESLMNWSYKTKLTPTFCLKGEDWQSEHFSAIRSEIDPNTMNLDVLALRESEEIILVAGQALSHCVAATIRDLVDGQGDIANKLCILTDATSSVPGFETIGEEFLHEMIGLGATTNTCSAIVNEIDS